MPSIFSKRVSFNTFREIAFYFVAEKGADVLLGSADYPDSGKSYLCLGPCLELVVEEESSGEEVKRRIKDFSFADDRLSIGYVSYECGHVLRCVKSSKKADYPYVHLKKYAAVLSYDATSGRLEFLHGEGDYREEIERMTEDVRSVPEFELPAFKESDIKMSLDEEAYKAGVSRTLEFIRDGLTYQLNLTTKFTLPARGVDPVQWFFSLNKRYPAPYYALFRTGKRVIMSTSPELFLRVVDGEVCSEPIKGTLRFDEYSDDIAAQLTSSVKEDSELSMIVDLVRNDISADCSYGSVIVEDHKSVFAVDNLLQMYSRVRGKLSAGRDCIDLLLNAFPGGSITGCPKKSSMELIDHLEPHTRGPYCGSVVAIKSPKDLISSIAIRTAVYDEDLSEISYWAGSGIVIDSKPAAEYLETVAKAGKILNPEML